MSARKTPPNRLTIDAGNLTGTVAELGAQTTWDLISEQFAAAGDKRWRDAWARGQEEQKRRDDIHAPFWLGGGVLAGVLAVASLVWSIWWVSATVGRNQRRYADQQMSLCARGDTVRCMEAVSEHGKEHGDADADRARLLRAAYRQVTGKELPTWDR